MNTPNPLLPQGSLPQRGKSTVYFKILMIVAVHTVLIGGILMVGCKNDTKDHAAASSGTDVTATDSNSTPMSTDIAPAAATTTTATPAMAAPVATAPAPLPAPMPAPIAPAFVAPVAPVVGREYVIVLGDTMGAIAKRSGVSLKALQDVNPGVDSKKLRIGNKLQIPAGSGMASTSSSGASSMPADNGTAASGDTTSYTVKSGDVLLKIAKSHGTTVKAILALNDMKTTSIRTGEKLKLPVMKVASTDPIPAASPAPTTSPAPIGAPASEPAPRTLN